MARSGGWLRTWESRVRLRHWVHFLALPLAGFDRALPLPVALAAALRGVLVAFGVLAFGYLLNSIADRGMDHSAEKNPLREETELAPLRGALVLLAACALVPALWSPWPVGLGAVACLLSGWIYSVGPRLKSLPGLGTVLNVSNFAPLLWVGLARPSPPPQLPLLAWSFTVLLLQNQLLHEAADAPEDAEGGVRTTFLRLGTAGTALLALVCGFSLTMLCRGFVHERPFLGQLPSLLSAVFVLPFPLALALLGRSPAVMARLRVVHRMVALLFGAVLFGVLYL